MRVSTGTEGYVFGLTMSPSDWVFRLKLWPSGGASNAGFPT
jgi:hypothetical protein